MRIKRIIKKLEEASDYYYKEYGKTRNKVIKGKWIGLNEAIEIIKKEVN